MTASEARGVLGEVVEQDLGKLSAVPSRQREELLSLLEGERLDAVGVVGVGEELLRGNVIEVAGGARLIGHKELQPCLAGGCPIVGGADLLDADHLAGAGISHLRHDPAVECTLQGGLLLAGEDAIGVARGVGDRHHHDGRHQTDDRDRKDGLDKTEGTVSRAGWRNELHWRTKEEGAKGA